MTRGEAAQPSSARRSASEGALASVLQGWLLASDVGGQAATADTPGFSVRVEVVQEEGAALAKAQVERGALSATVPVGAALRGSDADPRVALTMAAIDDPGRVVELGFIDPNGRISLTACGEQWSLAPVDVASGTAAPAAGAGRRLADRYFGGRPLPWWEERLAELKRVGPPALHALAVRRAQAAGLDVAADGTSILPPSPRSP